VEGVDHLCSTRFEALFAPDTRVLPRAATDGVLPRCWARRELIRVGFQALYADLPARQSERLRTLGYVGLLGGLIGGVGYCAKQVEAPDPFLSALVVERGVGDAYTAARFDVSVVELPVNGGPEVDIDPGGPGGGEVVVGG
jgi:hypothetical protein